MKKLVAIALAVALVATLGAGIVFATSNSSNGIPSAKTAVGGNDTDYTPVSDQWVNVPGLTDILIKTSNSSDLIVSLTAEADLITDVQLKGTGSSTSWAGIKVRALVDDNTAAPAFPGNVTLNYRLVTLSGTLWEPANSTYFTGLPEQYIDIYEETRSANGFNFIVPDVGVGVHTVTIQAYVDTGSNGIPAKYSAGAIIGKRTCVIEVDRLAN